MTAGIDRGPSFFFLPPLSFTINKKKLATHHSRFANADEKILCNHCRVRRPQPDLPGHISFVIARCLYKRPQRLSHRFVSRDGDCIFVCNFTASLILHCMLWWCFFFLAEVMGQWLYKQSEHNDNKVFRSKLLSPVSESKMTIVHQ